MTTDFVNEHEPTAEPTAIERREPTALASRFAEELTKRTRSEKCILMLDCSGSMSEHADVPGERRIDALRGVVAALRARALPFKQLIFNSGVLWSDVIPEPSGGTNMAGALEFAKKLAPVHVIVVSDGSPDGGEIGREACFKLATALGCRIDAYYVGPKGGPDSGGAIEFMNKLASLTGGASGATTFAELERKIAGALTEGRAELEEQRKGPIAL